jgi:hypothetical protein
VSRFTDPTFAPRTLKQQTVCIACQRWFVDPKIKNPDPKSKFYNTFQKPECYMGWLDRFGPFRDTPEKQAKYLAAPYSRKKGEGGLTNGWRMSKNAKCNLCSNAAMTPEAQANSEVAIRDRSRYLCNWGACTSRGSCGKLIEGYCTKHFNAVTAIAQAALAEAQPGVAYDAAVHFALGDARVHADPATKCAPGKVYVPVKNRPTSAGAGSSTDPMTAVAAS